MSDEFTLTGEAVRITALDTFVAFISGLIIFPRALRTVFSPIRDLLSFYYSSEHLCKYASRPVMGRFVLRLHDLCQLFYGDGGL